MIFIIVFEGLEGVAGVHGFERELEATRLTAPPMESSRVGNLFEAQNLGCFLVETFTAGKWTARAGYRYEDQMIEDLSLEEFGFIRNAKEKSHSLACGLTWRDFKRFGFDELAITANFSSIERLPSRRNVMHSGQMRRSGASLSAQTGWHSAWGRAIQCSGVRF